MRNITEQIQSVLYGVGARIWLFFFACGVISFLSIVMIRLIVVYVINSIFFQKRINEDCKCKT